MALGMDFPDSSRSLTSLKFLRDLPEYEETKPYYISGSLSDGQEDFRTNIQYHSLKKVPLFNLRGQEHRLSIEKHGFEIIKVPQAISCLDVKCTQREEYMEEVAKIVKRRLDATFVLCYDSKVGL